MPFDQEVNEIAPWLILQLERRRLSLTESERQRLINLAISIQRESSTKMMKERIKWELNLLADARSKIKVIVICPVKQIKNQTKIQAYLDSIRCPLLKDSLGWYTRVPRGYDVTETKKALLNIYKGKA